MELQSRIDELSVDIERQKEVLRQLETSKSLLQRQLNSILDPVARLPLEISSEIFIRCLPSLPKLGASHIPLLLLNVCNAWSDIALSTPALWAAIRVESPRAAGLEKGLQIWLQRARYRPLSLSFGGCFDDDVAAVVRQHTQQLKSFEVYHDDPNQVDDVDPFLGMGPGPFSSLETLTIGASPLIGMDFSLDSTLEMFRLAPNIVECIFDMDEDCTMSDIDEYTGEYLPGHLVLPNMRRLRFGRSLEPGTISGPDTILRHLSLPRLQTLYTSLWDVTDNDLLSFLERSSPPLRHLTLGAGDSGAFSGLEQILRLVPNLTHFGLYKRNASFIQDLFAALSQSSCRLIPMLQSLHVVSGMTDVSQSMWEVLHHALSVRRTHLTDFILRGPFPAPTPEMCSAFRELWSKEQNYV
ncbi:hypothetical protein DFH07DRAFT_815059 [Mycena maculata]|uniref:F-box domain-containing protein n=1 Tax=Mycena maculata TaxID=230809 RepID=A0AAD7JD13_9AGAR|nr:hypothetical protein DFH07DRAFT_815059 [Mycena maculata]